MRGPRPFRLFLMLILALTPLAQSFWFVQAWQVIDAMAWPGLRTLLQGLWIVAALVVLATALDMLRVRILPRRAFGPWGRAIARLWLIASCSNNSPPPLLVTMTPLGYMAPRSKGTWYFPEVYGIIAKTVQCLPMHCNSLQ